MKLLTDLIEAISSSREAERKIFFLARYFCCEASPDEKEIVFKLLLGIYPRRVVSLKQLKNQASEITGFVPWIIDRSETEAGSFIKAFNLLLRQTTKNNAQSPGDWLSKIAQLRNQPESSVTSFIKKEITKMDQDERFLILKIMTGTFRSPVTKAEVIQSVAASINVTPSIVALRLYELEKRQDVSFSNVALPVANEDKLTPQKFICESVLEQSLSELGNANHWNAYGKRDGIKVQLAKYQSAVHLWSEDGEILTDKFPEVMKDAVNLKMNTVIEGQLIAESSEKLENRLKKKQALAKDELQPVLFEVWSVADKNEIPQGLSDHFTGLPSYFTFREKVNFSDWQELKKIHNQCRTLGFSGLLLCKENQEYHFWQAVSYSIRAVILYVETGNLSPSGILSVTFGLYHQATPIPIAKVSATDSELDLNEITEFTKMNTVERFGPVRTIKPELVYELHFDDLKKAPRRKSGMVLSNVKVFRKISKDSLEINTLDDLRKFMQ